MPSPRDDLAADHIRWAFHRRLPSDAVRYFIQRASGAELRWPIAYMLHCLDQPGAVEFVVRELAATAEKLEGTRGLSSFALFADQDWVLQQERTGSVMSEPSRKRLLNIWQDQSAGKHLRRYALKFWAATRREGDRGGGH